MDAIQIPITRTEGINDYLGKVNGKARTNLLDASDVLLAAKEAEKKMEKFGLPKSKWRGARVRFGFHDAPKAYLKKGPLHGTVATLLYVGGRRVADGEWVLVTAMRCNCVGSNRNEIVFTDAQKEAIRENSVKLASRLYAD